MAKPITWRNIAGPSFNNSALSAAVGAFDRAGSGFGEVSDRLMETQGLIDDQYTNEAIRQALATGQVDPNLNPRASSLSVYDALLGKQKAESERLTEEQKRAESRAMEANLRADTEAQEHLNTPEMQEFDRQIKEAKMERERAQTATEQRNADLRLEELNFLRDKYNREIEISKGTDFINNEVEALTNQFANDIMRKKFGLDEKGISSDPNFVPPTERDMNEIWEEARSRAEGREGRRIIQGLYDGPTEGWKKSIFGELEARAKAIEDATETRRIEEEDRLRKAGRLSATYQMAGDFSRSVWRNGEVVPEEDQAILDAETLNSDREAIARLGTALGPGLNTKFSEDQKEVLSRVRDLFPTASLFVQIVKSFVVNGELDEDKLREAAYKDARDLLMAAQRRSNPREYILRDPDNPPSGTAAGTASGQQNQRPPRRPWQF